MPKISAWTPAETSPFIFDSLQVKFFHVDSGLQMENGSEQFGMLEGNAAKHFSPSPRWTFKNWQTFLFFHSGWYFPPDINQLSSARRTVVHTSSLILLSNVYGSVCLWQRPHRPRLFRMSPSSFLLSVRLFTHSSIRPLIHWYSIWPASVVSGPKGLDPLTVVTGSSGISPAIIVITVCAYIGFCCFVPHLPSSAGSLSSNLPVITNSRRGNRRKTPCGKLDSTSNDTRCVLVGDFLNRQLCFHSCFDSQRYSYVNASAHALVNLFHNYWSGAYRRSSHVWSKNSVRIRVIQWLKNGWILIKCRRGVESGHVSHLLKLASRSPRST